MASFQTSDGFDRLQDFLLAMRTGDVVRASDISHVSGLSEAVCRTVLEGLERAGLMAHPDDDRFVRKTLDTLPQ